MRLFLVPLALVACNQVDPKTFPPPATVTKRVLLGRNLDILFVIDNSASTSDKQLVFASNFPRFVDALDAFPGGRPDLHIGVVTTTVDIGVQGFGPGCPSPAPYDDGLLVNTPRVAAGCTGPSGRFLVDVAGSGGSRTTNYTGTLSDTLSCIAQVGSTGCGFEAPLDAMKRALDGSRPENAGFIRPDADLAVVILADEDDCSVADSTLFALGLDEAGPGDFRCQPLAAYDCSPPISTTLPGTYAGCTLRRNGYLHDPQDYAKFLATIKDPSQTVVGLVAGDPQSTIQTGQITTPFSQSLALLPSCQATINGNPEIARPGNRLDDFRSAFGDRGVFETVCQADYSGALSAFGQSMNNMMSPCLDGGIATNDIDPANAGLQLSCSVTDRDASNTVVGDPFPPCEMTDATTPSDLGAHPCYWLEASAAACGTTATQIALHVSRIVPVDASVIVTQATCAAAP
jgi:hypothetical protein